MASGPVAGMSAAKPCIRRRRVRLAIFWLVFMWETLGHRHVLPLVRMRIGPLHVDGLEHVLRGGSFVLAVNHYGEQRALDIIAAVLAAANLQRPDLANRYLLVAGSRGAKRRAPSPLAHLMQRLLHLVYGRWAKHVLLISLGNERASASSLRRWRACAGEQPSLVFPEGRRRAAFGAVRPGAGRWLASLGVPTLPVGAWRQGCAWHVHFGAPVSWSRREELRDKQLGLAIAALLPSELAPAWTPYLEAWREAHRAEQPSDVSIGVVRYMMP
jgi:1-acyl-sn-glycerol-3-phosphate acyltransferase